VFTKGDLEGCVQITFSNNDEYHGLYKNNDMNGEGIFFEASTGKIQRGIFHKGEMIEVLESLN